MINFGKHLPRRTFLKGAGTAIALPILDAMIPAFGAARAASPRRLAVVYVPNGIDMRHWTPKAEGTRYELPRLLEPIAPYREDFLVVSGLAHNNGRALGDGPGDHARAASTFLTGMHPKKTAGADISVGVSVDAVAAAATAGRTRYASLELGCEDGRQVGNCDSGYSCAYSNSISWRTPSTPNPPEINPRLVFERLFGADTDESPAARARRQRYRKSILDSALEDTRQLQASLGATDRRKLDEYVTAVREIERRIETAERDAAAAAPEIEKPTGIPIDFIEHVHLMFDLMILAFQTDSTRIATFMMGREGSSRTYREIGIAEGHHPLTHHRNDPEMLEKVSRINRFHVERFAYLLGKLKSTRDGDGTLLDSLMLVYGSGLSDGNRHWHHDLPVLVVGRAGGSLRTGRHIRYTQETPLNNLYLALLDRMGVPAEKLGDSTGRVENLETLSDI
jgi:hypothetical protein